MADHYRKTVELLDEAECLRTEVQEEYRKAMPNRVTIGSLHDRMRFALDRAKIHAQLAEVQALVDAGQMLDSRTA